MRCFCCASGCRRRGVFKARIHNKKGAEGAFFVTRANLARVELPHKLAALQVGLEQLVGFPVINNLGTHFMNRLLRWLRSLDKVLLTTAATAS